MNAIAPGAGPLPTVPTVYVAGTCMNAGKTSAACQLIRQLARRGHTVGACKLTGISLRRDTLQMSDYGAALAVSFNEAGVVATNPQNAVAVTRTLLAHVARRGVDVIVAELGDGLFGEYGVAQILEEVELRERADVLVLCANDPVGAWGAQRLLEERYQLRISVVCGPATDNDVGVRFIRKQLGLPAINARTHGSRLGEFVAEQLDARLARCPA